MRGPFVLLTLASFCLSIVTIANAQTAPSQSPSQPASQPTSQVQTQASSANQDLPWLPGLGQNPGRISPASLGQIQTGQIRQTAETGIARPGVLRQPQIGSPIAGARPIPTAQRNQATNAGNTNAPIEPRSVLTDIRNLTGSPAVPAVAIQNNGPVVPAAFFEQEEQPSAANQQDNRQNQNPTAGTVSNSEVVDARITTVTRGMQQLPNEDGQVWRTYDISPYTYSVQTNTRPEQAVIDWILKETGTELWFSQPMGILNASRDKLHVYHTPAIQNRVKPIVDRFVQARGKPLVVGLRLMTIASPDWRSTAFSMMQPVPSNSPGVEAWLMTKENAAILGGMLRNRADYQEQGNNDLIVADGQQYSLSRTRPVNFTRSLRLVNDAYPRYEAVVDRVDEGYTVDLSVLSSLDGRSIEAIVGCDINQIEKMQPVQVDLPTASGQTQPFQLQIPQMVSWNVRERFRWPSDMVLVLSCGVVATPGPQRQALLGISSLFNGNRRRADALMFIEYKGAAQTLNPGAQTTVPITAATGQNVMIPGGVPARR